jgi:2-hydroxychromene-2-carboxylate isomerase
VWRMSHERPSAARAGRPTDSADPLAGDGDPAEAVLVIESVSLYFDLGSPYAYLAVARAEAVFGRQPDLEPVLLGAIFRLRGSGSWSQTSERATGIAEVQRRALAYGLPAVAWPDGWPLDGLRYGDDQLEVAASTLGS